MIRPNNAALYIKSSEEQNAIVDEIKSGSGHDLVLALCQAYANENECGGNLHIILDDGNLENCNLDWCSGYCCAKGDQNGQDICNFLRFMKMEDRERIYAALR